MSQAHDVQPGINETVEDRENVVHSLPEMHPALAEPEVFDGLHVVGRGIGDNLPHHGFLQPVHRVDHDSAEVLFVLHQLPRPLFKLRERGGFKPSDVNVMRPAFKVEEDRRGKLTGERGFPESFGGIDNYFLRAGELPAVDR